MLVYWPFDVLRLGQPRAGSGAARLYYGCYEIRVKAGGRTKSAVVAAALPTQSKELVSAGALAGVGRVKAGFWTDPADQSDGLYGW